MDNITFAERVAAACKREIKMNESNDRVFVQNHPNDLNVQLSFDLRPWAWIVKQAEVYDINMDRWYLIFETTDGRYTLQENTDIDGPEGIIDHYDGRTLAGCLKKLQGLLNE